MEITPESFLKETIECLKSVYVDLSKNKDATHQLKSDILAGYFRKDGVLIPLSSYEHRIQFDNHELFVLEGYITLAEQLLAEADNQFAYFSLRTLCEVGLDKINVLFAEEVSDADRNTFRLIDTLSDLAGMMDAPYKQLFLKLLNEERSSLEPNVREVFEKAEQFFISGEEIPLSILKKIRMLLNSKLRIYIEKISIPIFLKGKSKLDNLHIAWSHLLHGNPIMLRIALNPRFSKGHKNHAHAMLWLTSMNTLSRVRRHIRDAELQNKVDHLLSIANEVWRIIVSRREVKYKDSSLNK